ncbi:MAG: tetratricopeptide repeat protein, partial [Thermomicrobiales bacterium]|nr:tetratricopeptide repeat protein [Thermomicrobiales bacterium]
GEHRFPLRPLGAEDAVRLFVERADLKPDAAALDSIAELCRHLDGLPLAIELAAARCPLLSPRQIADRLDRRFEVLRSHEADIRRWNTLRATIAWSCALLSADEARLFRSLSVFTGSFDFGAVEAISDLDANLDLLEGLVNQSMLVIELRPGESAARYRLLESLRDYAREWAREHQEIEPVAARHAHHYQGVSREAATLLNTPAHLEALARFDREHDNIVAALEWMIAAGASRDACDLAASLTPWWHRSSRFDLATRYLERALALAPDDVSIQAARAGNAFALIALSAGRLGHGKVAVERAIVITRTIGDRAGEAEALTLKGRYLQRIGELDRAEGMFSAALEIRTADGDQRGMGVNLLNLGTIAGLKRDFVTCGATYQSAWTHANASGDLATEAVILGNLGELAAHTGEYQRGLEYLDRATAIFRRFGDHDRVAATLTNRAELYLLLGDYPGAVETSAMTVAQHRETRNRIHLANSLYVQGIALAAIGALLQALGAFREGARLEYELNDLTNVIYYIEAIARLLGEGDDPLLAARLLGGAERLREEERAGDYEPFDYAGTVRATRARLSEAQFAAAWQSGRELSPAGLLTEASNLGLIADGAPVFLYRRMPGRPAPGNELTPRQIDVLRLVAHGESNRQIAETLAISPRTVERHLTMIYGHFGVDRRSAAVAAAAERGLL